MWYSFHVQHMRSSETSKHTDDEIRAYTKLALECEYEPTPPQKHVFVLMDVWRNESKDNPDLTLDVLRHRLERQMGYVFYETAAEAHAAADAVVGRCRRIIEEMCPTALK